MLDENNAILDAANSIKQASENSKLVEDKTKAEYGAKLDAVIAKTNAANAEIGKRLDAIAEAKKTYTGDGILAYVQRHDGTSGVYEGFSVTKDGKETGKQITDTYKGRSNDVASLQKQVDSWQAQLDKLHTDAMDNAGMTAKRQQFVDSLTSKIAAAKQKIESLRPSMSKVEELYSDKKYADFMSRLNTDKNAKIYEAAIQAQDEAIIDDKSVEEIKAIVKQVLKTYKKKNKKPSDNNDSKLEDDLNLTGENKANNVINKVLEKSLSIDINQSKEEAKAELEENLNQVKEAINLLSSSQYAKMGKKVFDDILQKLNKKLERINAELKDIDETYKQIEEFEANKKINIDSTNTTEKVKIALEKAEQEAKNRPDGEDKVLTEYEQNKIKNHFYSALS